MSCEEHGNVERAVWTGGAEALESKEVSCPMRLFAVVSQLS